MYRDILICTVGTSLIGHAKVSTEPALKKAFEEKNVQAFATALSPLDPADRSCRAEINSINSILLKDYLAGRTKLYLLVSDTEEGQFLGRIFELFYRAPANVWRFDDVKTKVLAGLADSDARRFRSEGLRNLVRAIAKIVRHYGSNRIVINATGGYKAQISFAGMIGQALGIPVCYLFERFSEVIELPPQPISLDLSFWLENVDLFYLLAADEASQDPTAQDPRFSALVDREKIDGQQVIGLSAVGQLFHESFSYRFVQQRDNLLPPPSDLEPSQKEIKYEDKNLERHKGLRQWLERLREQPYVNRIYTHYYNPDLPVRKCFRTSATGKIDQIEGWFSDGKATTKFDLMTTAATEEQRNAILADKINKIKNCSTFEATKDSQF